MTDYSKYKKPVKKVVQCGDLPVKVSYAPSRSITYLTGCLKDEKRIATFNDMAERAIPYERDPEYDYRIVGVLDDLLLSPKDSAKVIEDFIRLLCLLTDDEMLARVVDAAPKKKNGHLAANRNAIDVSMDGAFSSGEYYRVFAKSDKEDGIALTVKREKPNLHPYAMTQTADFLAQNKDIVERMGL